MWNHQRESLNFDFHIDNSLCMAFRFLRADASAREMSPTAVGRSRVQDCAVLHNQLYIQLDCRSVAMQLHVDPQPALIDSPWIHLSWKSSSVSCLNWQSERSLHHSRYGEKSGWRASHGNTISATNISFQLRCAKDLWLSLVRLLYGATSASCSIIPVSRLKRLYDIFSLLTFIILRCC